MVRDQIVEIGLYVKLRRRARDRVDFTDAGLVESELCELRGDRLRQVDLVLKRDSKLDARRWPISVAERHAYEQVGQLAARFHELDDVAANGFSGGPTDLEDHRVQPVGWQAGRHSHR